MPVYNVTPIKIVDCIILFGQSNGEGSSNVGSNTSTYLTTQNNTRIFHKNNNNSATDNGYWEHYLYGVNHQWRSAMYNYTGPDITIGHKYHALTGKKLFIIKYAYGGSALVDVGVINTSGLWQHNADPAMCNDFPHYSIAINNFIIPAINQAKRNGIKLNIKALVWTQGESDANGDTRYLTYESTLIALIEQMKIDLASYNVLASPFKPIISRIHNSLGRPRQNEIRTALVNVANYYSAPWINTDAYPLEADNVHFTKVAQETHGDDIATALASL